MTEQPGFILYKSSAEMINRLSNQEAGKLIKAIFAYKIEGLEPDSLTNAAEMAFLSIKTYLDRDAENFQRAHSGEAGA